MAGVQVVQICSHMADPTVLEDDSFFCRAYTIRRKQQRSASSRKATLIEQKRTQTDHGKRQRSIQSELRHQRE